MSKLYLVDIGYVEPTVIYELVPKKVAELKHATLSEVAHVLRAKGAVHLLVDNGYARVADEFLVHGFNILNRGRLPQLDGTDAAPRQPTKKKGKV